MATSLTYRNPRSGQVVQAENEKMAGILESGGYVKATAAEQKAFEASQPAPLQPSQPPIELPTDTAQGRMQAEERELNARQAQMAQEIEAMRAEVAARTTAQDAPESTKSVGKAQSSTDARKSAPAGAEKGDAA